MKIDFRKFIQPSLIVFSFLIALILLLVGSFIFVPSLQYKYFESSLETSIPEDSQVNNDKELKGLKNEVNLLNKKIERLIPGGTYLVINTTDNTFKLFKNKKLERTGICSTGSYIELEGNNEKKWVFETPKGVFRVQGKITNPVWRKPDWAFAEEGLPIPPANDASRYEYGVLGDYALSIGNGYLIHGTLYQRFLGLAVTHGCVRLNDSDLEYIYNQMPVGAKVFIY